MTDAELIKNVRDADILLLSNRPTITKKPKTTNSTVSNSGEALSQ
jgi:hypothetical protein